MSRAVNTYRAAQRNTVLHPTDGSPRGVWPRAGMLLEPVYYYPAQRINGAWENMFKRVFNRRPR